MDNYESVAGEISVSQLTGGQWRTIYWGFWWRSFCVLVAIVLLVSAIYISVTFLTIITTRTLIAYKVLPYVKTKTALTVIKIISGISGIPVGIYLGYYYIKWILESHYGSLRLAIIVRDNINDSSASEKPRDNTNESSAAEKPRGNANDTFAKIKL